MEALRFAEATYAAVLTFMLGAQREKKYMVKTIDYKVRNFMSAYLLQKL